MAKQSTNPRKLIGEIFGEEMAAALLRDTSNDNALANETVAWVGVVRGLETQIAEARQRLLLDAPQFVDAEHLKVALECVIDGFHANAARLGGYHKAIEQITEIVGDKQKAAAICKQCGRELTKRIDRLKSHQFKSWLAMTQQNAGEQARRESRD